MSHLFFIIFFSLICILVMLIAKQKYYAYMIGMILAINLVGNCMIWIINSEKVVDKRLEKIENISNNVKDTVDKIDSIDKTIKKPVKKLDDLDKKITDGVNKLLGRGK